MVWSTFRTKVGLVEEASRRVGFAADDDLSALCSSILDMALDDRELSIPEDRSDVHVLARTISELAHDLLHALLELVCHAFDDVDALDPHADMSRVQHRVEHGTARRALDVRIRADDHRVLAAELERVRNQLLRAGSRDLLAGPDASRERDLLHASVNQRSPGLSIAVHHLHDAFGNACLSQ